MPWEDRPAGGNGVVWRSSLNPIVTRDHVPAREQHLQLRRRALRGRVRGRVPGGRHDAATMNLHAGRSADGVTWELDPEPITFTPGDGRVAEIQQRFEHAYDPRVTRLEDRFYVTWCNGYHGPTIGLAHTTDFRAFVQLDNAYLPFNRNGVLFPRRVGGVYAMLSRPKRRRSHGVRGHLLLGKPRPRALGQAPARDGARAALVAGDEDRGGPDPDRDGRGVARSCTTGCSRRATASSTRWALRCSTSTSPGAC